jgi:allantoinase
MIGYGDQPGDAQWPGDARIALQFAINYEDGGENAISHDDSAAELFLTELIGASQRSACAT